ncbi:hypothetical protein [Streptosporangium subroseum]|nr:hypothetical protein OHB15_46465 [Streptosporangium subroseum]
MIKESGGRSAVTTEAGSGIGRGSATACGGPVTPAVERQGAETPSGS